MQIKYENIILRDMIETDIEDYVRWFTAEREWENGMLLGRRKIRTRR